MLCKKPAPNPFLATYHRCARVYPLTLKTMKSTYKKYTAGLAIAATVTTLAIALPAFAQTSVNASATVGAQAQTGGMHNGAWQGRGPGGIGAPGQMKGMKPAVFGTVTAVNGTTLTVASRGFGKDAATTTYSVNASNTTVMKNNATSTLSSVAVNDRVVVEGTVSGTNVTATMIRDGIPMMMRGRGPTGTANGGTGQTPPFKGNGEPVVAGTVSAVTGNSITITTSSNTSYTIDATSAAVTKGNASSTVSAVAVGDYVVAQGTVNGNSVTASTILDQQARPASATNGNGPKSGPAMGGGVFGMIGSFFKKIFGF